MKRKAFTNPHLPLGGIAAFAATNTTGLPQTGNDTGMAETAMNKNICTACGTHYQPGNPLPQLCDICNDDRQFIPPQGQHWTSIEALAAEKTIHVQQLGTDIYALRVIPQFAIDQQAFFVVSNSGNILWDCLPFLDEATAAFIEAKGGLKAMAISHPHYYSAMALWAKRFDCPVYLHQDDAQWIRYTHPYIQLWQGAAQPLWDGIRIIHTAGHFPGSAVLHLPAQGKGLLLTGDSVYVARDRKRVSFMYSYPNHIPLPLKAIELIDARITPLDFDAVYGAFAFAIIPSGAKEIFKQSIQRYMNILEGTAV